MRVFSLLVGETDPALLSAGEGKGDLADYEFAMTQRPHAASRGASSRRCPGRPCAPSHSWKGKQILSCLPRAKAGATCTPGAKLSGATGGLPSATGLGLLHSKSRKAQDFDGSYTRGTE